MCQFQNKCCNCRGGHMTIIQKRHLGNLNLIISLQITYILEPNGLFIFGNQGVVGRHIWHDEDQAVGRRHNPNRLAAVLPSSTK